MTATDTPETNVSSTICRRSSRDRYCRTGFAGRLACSISLIHTLSGERPQPNPSERMHLTQTHTPDGLMSTLTHKVPIKGQVVSTWLFVDTTSHNRPSVDAYRKRVVLAVFMRGCRSYVST